MVKLKTFQVMAKCHRDVSVEIKAENLEDALVKAKELKDGDFVEVLGDYNDGSTEIYGVFES
jgi:hypothetical protein